MSEATVMAGQRIGYARVSTIGQDLIAQRELLTGVGCVRIFEEKISGAKRNRPELRRMLEHLRPGDTLVVARLDRLARSTRDLLDTAERLREIGAGLRSLAEPWADTTSPAGKMILTVMSGIADFERSLILERTGAGREAAKARGVRFGRSKLLSTDQVELAKRMKAEEGMSAATIARSFGVHRATIYRSLADEDASQDA